MKHRIKQIAATQGIKTAYQLAKKTGIGQTTCYDLFLDNGHIPDPKTITRLYKHLKCNPNDLIYADMLKSTQNF